MLHCPACFKEWIALQKKEARNEKNVKKGKLKRLVCQNQECGKVFYHKQHFDYCSANCRDHAKGDNAMQTSDNTATDNATEFIPAGTYTPVVAAEQAIGDPEIFVDQLGVRYLVMPDHPAHTSKAPTFADRMQALKESPLEPTKYNVVVECFTCGKAIPAYSTVTKYCPSCRKEAQHRHAKKHREKMLEKKARVTAEMRADLAPPDVDAIVQEISEGLDKLKNIYADIEKIVETRAIKELAPKFDKTTRVVGVPSNVLDSLADILADLDQTKSVTVLILGV